jgi:hypothetical protein
MLSTQASAAVPAEEAKQLGTKLTWWGAEVAGNKDGTIPAYTGGLTKPPAAKVDAKGYTSYPDPFADEKPLFRITAQNMAQYADKLAEGQKALLKKFPDYYIDVFPTHRTASYPESLREATVRNATQCKTAKGGIAVEEECRGGLPFPIPKTGYEVMWNKLLAYHKPEYHSSYSYTVDPTGRVVLASKNRTYGDSPFYRDAVQKSRYNVLITVQEEPPRMAGQMNGVQDFLDPDVHPRMAFGYTPGQRRVRMAPELAYDTPLAPTGGAQFFDDIYLFLGKMDRFDFKLIGKKEMFIPSNAYKFYLSKADQAHKEKFINPEVVRWELHRVWVIEGALKPGERHGYSKRRYYFDEDSQLNGMVDTWDQGGGLFRTGFLPTFQAWDQGFPYGTSYVMYDFVKNMYSTGSFTNGEGFKWVEPLSEKEMTPDALANRAIR